MSVGLWLHAQCLACTPDSDQSPRPFGFNPPELVLPPNKDTTLVIYFTFPDSITRPPTVYPNYAIWVDSLRLDVGLVTSRNGSPFAYNTSDPAAGAIHFDQMHRFKSYDPNDPNKKANFVVYQNPGGTPGATPPIGCARVCLKSGAQEGSDTLRVKVRVFVPALGDGANKDTTNLAPSLLGSPSFLDTTFRYRVRVVSDPSLSIVSRHSSVSRLSVAPNPAWGPAEVRFTLTHATKLSIRAFSLDGREVYSSSQLYEAGDHVYVLHLPAGMYVVSLEDGKSRLTHRLVILE